MKPPQPNPPPTGPEALLCLACDYDLAGLSPDDICPECGTPIGATRPPERKLPLVISLLLIAIGLFLLAVGLLDHTTATAAQIAMGASPRGSALSGEVLAVLMLAMFSFAWAVSAGSWLRAVATRRSCGAARIISLGVLLSAAVPAIALFVLYRLGFSGAYRLEKFFAQLGGAVVMVTPVIISMIAIHATRTYDCNIAPSLARTFWRAQLRGLFPMIIAGSIIGVLSLDRGRRPSEFDLSIEMVLPLTVGVWSYWQGFQTLRAAVALVRSAPSPNPDAKP